MVVPQMLSVEDWEVIAVAAQRELVEQARDDLHGTSKESRSDWH